MEYRRLGKAGLKVSALSFGSWVTFGTQVDQREARKCMEIAFEAGINFFDNAEVYANGKSEAIMGAVLQELALPRTAYCVSSKVFWGGERPTENGLSRKHVMEACHAALKRLQVDYLDLYFCHRPDPETPIEETVRAMDVLVRQGKILYWGTSEWSAEQITQAYELSHSLGLTPPSMEQPQYSLFARERVEKEYAPLYPKYGMGTTIWSPLASGLLTGKYNEGIPPGTRATLPGYEWLREKFESIEGKAKIEKARKLTAVAKELGVPLSQLAIAWCLKNPNVSTVILGASRVSQLQDNLKALDVYAKLGPDIVQKIEALV